MEEHPDCRCHSLVSRREKQCGLHVSISEWPDLRAARHRTGNHQSPVTLQFKHQLAKVRVVAKGKAQVRNMEMVNLPGVCYIEEGIITGQSLPINRILMPRVEREGIDTYWEANVGPGVEIQWFSLDGMTFALNTPVTTQAGALHTITWTVNSAGTQSIRLSTDSIGNNGTEQSQ